MPGIVPVWCRRLIDSLFPAPVLTLTATPEMWSGTLLPEEEGCLSPRAIAKRRREFTAGRVCARAALARLGIRDFPILAAADRSPVWPPGIVGSLSHCADYCGVAVARRGPIAGLGLDVERARPLEGRVVSIICTGAEISRLGSSPDLPADLWAMIVFSAKESVYKCWHPLAKRSLDFHDVEIDLAAGAGTFTARILGTRRNDDAHVPPVPRVLAGRFAWNDAHVFAGVALTDEQLVSAG
jgi:4'-phosphopantetheinyl transferase EntD